jgi:hypothetical protein
MYGVTMKEKMRAVTGMRNVRTTRSLTWTRNVLKR